MAKLTQAGQDIAGVPKFEAKFENNKAPSFPVTPTLVVLQVFTTTGLLYLYVRLPVHQGS